MLKSRIRILSLLVVVVMAITALVGCTPTETPGTEQSSESGEPAESGQSADQQGPAASGEDSITLMASQNWIKDIDRELFKKFEQETGIEVKVMITPDNGYETLLGTTLSGGSNAVDVFMFSAGSLMNNIGIPDIAVDLSSEPWAENLEQWAIDANSANGKLVGFSTWGVDYEGILYNKTYFEENNLEVPTTWTGFMELCDQIKALGKTPLYEGINGVWHTQAWAYTLTPVMLQENPNFVADLNDSPDNKFSDNAKFMEGLSQVKAMLEAKDGGNPKYYTNDGQAEDWFGSYIALNNRDCVMMLTYSAYVAELAKEGSTDEWGMFPVPLCDNQIGVSNGGGVSKYINKNSDVIEESKQLLNFLAQSENLEAYYTARTDLVTAAFKDVKAVSATSATTEMLERTKDTPAVMFIKDVNYWDPDVYKYMQGFAAGTMTVEQFAEKVDEFRATMYEAAQAN